MAFLTFAETQELDTWTNLKSPPPSGRGPMKYWGTYFLPQCHTSGPFFCTCPYVDNFADVVSAFDISLFSYHHKVTILIETQQGELGSEMKSKCFHSEMKNIFWLLSLLLLSKRDMILHCQK